MKPETRAYLRKHASPSFEATDHDGRVKVIPAARTRGGVIVTVDDYPDGAMRALDRAETARLRDWLTDHLAHHPEEPTV